MAWAVPEDAIEGNFQGEIAYATYAAWRDAGNVHMICSKCIQRAASRWQTFEDESDRGSGWLQLQLRQRGGDGVLALHRAAACYQYYLRRRLQDVSLRIAARVKPCELICSVPRQAA